MDGKDVCGTIYPEYLGRSVFILTQAKVSGGLSKIAFNICLKYLTTALRIHSKKRLVYRVHNNLQIILNFTFSQIHQVMYTRQSPVTFIQFYTTHN